jgi:hypothetical protein
MRSSTHGKALSASIHGQGSVPFASRSNRSAMARSPPPMQARQEHAGRLEPTSPNDRK